MNLLAFDTSTERMSIALQRGQLPQADGWQHDSTGGALTSTELIPQIQRLMGLAALQWQDLSAIVFGAGPGAFTGLRTACSVAQGLAFGASLPVLPVDTLLAVAQEAHIQLGEPSYFQVTAMLDARMDEMYIASYLFESNQWTCTLRCRLISPENFKPEPNHVHAGNVFAVYATRLPTMAQPGVVALPTARALLRLAPALLAAGGAVRADQALPTYIRDKVAQTTQERQAGTVAVSGLTQNRPS